MRNRALVPAVIIFCSCAIFGSLPTIFGEAAPTVDQMKQMLDVSQRRAQLEMEGSAPFHLVASYVAFDAQGNRAGTGKLDELWESPTQYRRIWTLPAINRVTAPDGSEHFPEDYSAPPTGGSATGNCGLANRSLGGDGIYDARFRRGATAVISAGDDRRQADLWVTSTH